MSRTRQWVGTTLDFATVDKVDEIAYNLSVSRSEVLRLIITQFLQRHLAVEVTAQDERTWGA